MSQIDEIRISYLKWSSYHIQLEYYHFLMKKQLRKFWSN